MKQSSQSSVNFTAPSLPKGGGAIQGMGESVGQAGPTGMSSMSLPLPISAGRGVAPSLGLNYSSGGGNGVFGLGWYCGTMSISRRTSHGVPKYDNNDEFLGPDGEVLVMVTPTSADPNPVMGCNTYGTKSLGDTYTVTRYMPRIEGSFNRLEHWVGSTNDFWLLHGNDGTLHMLGKTSNAKLADTLDTTHTAVWMLEESVTPTGEHIYYQYTPENGDNLEDGDTGRDHSAKRYLTAVQYGNAAYAADLYLWDDTPAFPTWYFTLIFDYGERGVEETTPPPFIATDTWSRRADPFSSYAYGFEVRTYRLCRQVLMFHNFPDELTDDNTLVARLLLEYDETATLTTLTSAKHVAYEPDSSDTLQEMPPLDIGYSQFALNESSTWQTMDAMPGLNDGQRYQLIDLYGEGLPGILYRTGNQWRYRSPIRDITTGGDAVAYSDWEILAQVPAMQGVRSTLMDITGDGHLDWLVTQPGMSGFFTLNSDKSWGNFTPFSALPTEFFHPQAQFAQLMGSGLADLAMIGPKSVRVYANQGTGFSMGLDVDQADDIILPVAGRDARELVAFADILGSGQAHLVKVRYNSVTCWPNLGNGKFGSPIDIPLPADTTLDTQTAFNPDQLFFADIDGSGTVDLLYATKSAIAIYQNQSGNSFTKLTDLDLPAGVTYDRLCQITLADVQGNGTSNLVLSVPYMTPAHYIYSFSADKPYLLNTISNNLGATHQLSYRSSAQEWLDEKSANAGAIPALPFAMHLLTQTVTTDEITGNTLSQSCLYRAGVYDGKEREFRGFGYVESQDTNHEAVGSVGTPLAAASLTKSWFHCGREGDERALFGTPFALDSAAYTLQSTFLSTYDTTTGMDVAIDSLSDTDKGWMYRSLKGATLRSELYGLDDTSDSTDEGLPYSCSYNRMHVRLVQAGSTTVLPVVMSDVLEQISYNYERVSVVPAPTETHELTATTGFDPLIAHQVTLQKDQYGAGLWSVAVAYPRRQGQTLDPCPENLPSTSWASSYDDQQNVVRIYESLASVIHLDEPQGWRLGLPDQQRANQLVLDSIPTGGISYESLIDPNGPLSSTATRYFAGQSEVVYQPTPPNLLALVDHTCSAVLDAPSLEAYKDITIPADYAFDQIGYVKSSYVLEKATTSGDLWSVESGFTTYADESQFFRPLTVQNTKLTGVTTVTYDSYTIGVLTQTDAVGNKISAVYDYRFLAPWQVVDINGNTSEVQLDALGRAVGSSFYGTENGVAVGFNPVSDYPVSPSLTVADAITSAVAADYKQYIAAINITDLFSWMGQVSPEQLSSQKKVATELWQLLIDHRMITPSGYIRAAGRNWARDPESNLAINPELAPLLADTGGMPVNAVSLVADNYPDPNVAQQTHISVSYSDGFGRILQQCARVAAGPNQFSRNSSGNVTPDTSNVDPRWAVSGRVEYDNKGQVVRAYQPFFVNDWQYVIDSSLVTNGYSDTNYYDALGRNTHTVTALMNPDRNQGYVRRMTYYPWFTVAEDENDTIGIEDLTLAAKNIMPGSTTRH
jgi:hypothetical protein